jgi:riboflavin biosynthesis pyrimidine reductase
MHALVEGDEIADPLTPYARVDRRVDGDRCWVMANMVGGLDGAAAIGGRVGALSAGTDSVLFRRMRALADVVVVGAETVRAERYGPVRLDDDLRATRRREGRPPVPPLAVVSRSLRFDWTIPAFAEAEPDARSLVVTSADADGTRLDEARRHADVVVAGDSGVELGAMLGELARRGHRVVLCEGGPTLLGEVVAAGLLDELCLTIAPVMGGDPLPVAVSAPGGPVVGFRLAHVVADGDTLFLRYERTDEGPVRTPAAGTPSGTTEETPDGP